LLTDVILVIVYFQIVSSAEMPQSDGTVTASLRNEASWIAVVFVIYFAWDLITKASERDEENKFKWLSNPRGSKLVQRAWASVACMAIALLGYAWLPKDSPDLSRVLYGDVGLLCLVLLFRAAKRKDFSDLNAANIRGISLLLVLTLVFFEMSAQRLVGTPAQMTTPPIPTAAPFSP
jgi:hypothetical protein